MDYAIALVDILYRYLGHTTFFILQPDLVSLHHHPELTARDGRQFCCAITRLYLCSQFPGVQAAGYDMVSEDAREGSLIFGFDEVIDSAFRQLVEGFISGSED